MHRVSIFVSLLLLLTSYTDVHAADGDDSAYYNQFSVCSDSKVEVVDMSLYCDSPGSYYYGSNKYRNSATCQAGDKAKVQVALEITEDLESDPYLTVEVQGYGTVESVTVLKSISFCETVSSYDGAICPSAGKYYTKNQFYWGSQNDNYDYSFVPKIVVGIASTDSSNSFDLGGANTNKCYSGNTFSNWTTGVRKSAANTVSSFIISFGILIATVLFIVLFTYCIIKETSRRKYYKESDTMINKSSIVVNENVIVDEIHDYHRIAALMGKESGLVV
jgi:hypothetical protein